MKDLEFNNNFNREKVYKFIDISNIFKKKLLNLGAFKGDYVIRTHFSHYPFLLGTKNGFCFYDIRKVFLLLLNALRFLKKVKKNSNIEFIFAGTPTTITPQIEHYFKRFDITYKFFSNEKWQPGYITKNHFNKNRILIVYNCTSNKIAYDEAVLANIPVVGFVTPSCDLQRIDYPILLNFKDYPTWYLKFLFSIFS